MPLLAGGIAQGEKAKYIVEKLSHHLLQYVNTSSVCVLENKAQGIKIVAGFEDFESSSELLVPLENNSGILAGKLFSKNFEALNVHHLNLNAIKKTNGKHLTENYWGRYILVAYDERGISIFRDPLGFSTLFYMQLEDGYVFASRISFLYDVLDTKPELNWKYLTEFLVSSYCVSTVTPFNQINEVLPGHAVNLNVGHEPTVKQFWDPIEHCTPFEEDNLILEEQLFDTIRRCSNALLDGCAHVKIALSGGLDSSSLLAIIKDGNPLLNISAYNMYHPAIASSDEREFAQEVAGKYNVDLSYVDISEYLPFDYGSISIRFDRPHEGRYSTKIPQQIELCFGEERISGQGGDQLFFAGAPLEMVLDYYHEKGVVGVIEKIKDIAAYHRLPFYIILKKIVSLYGFEKKSNSSYHNYMCPKEPWMNNSLEIDKNKQIFTPTFLKSLRNVPPAKAQQIVSICSSIYSIDHGHVLGRKSTLYPLLSQPVVELALAIPSYKSLQNGHDRYIFREAMQRHTRGKFLWRKTKGELSGAAIRGLRKNFEKTRTLLLEGHFARLGYVDREKLSEALLLLKHGNIKPFWSVFRLYTVERWLSAWNI